MPARTKDAATPEDKAIGLRVRTLRKEAGQTQQEFATRIGVGEQHLSKVERGVVRMGDDMLDGLVNATNCTRRWVLRGEDGPDPIDDSGDPPVLAEIKRLTFWRDLPQPVKDRLDGVAADVGAQLDFFGWVDQIRALLATGGQPSTAAAPTGRKPSGNPNDGGAAGNFAKPRSGKARTSSDGNTAPEGRGSKR